jgi:hypothetical protein
MEILVAVALALSLVNSSWDLVNKVLENRAKKQKRL